MADVQKEKSNIELAIINIGETYYHILIKYLKEFIAQNK